MCAVLLSSSAGFMDVSAAEINHKSESKVSLLNCLSSGSNNINGITERFEPLGCSTYGVDIDSKSTSDVIEGDSGHLPNNISSDPVNYDLDFSNKPYLKELYGTEFEDPDEEGWN